MNARDGATGGSRSSTSAWLDDRPFGPSASQSGVDGRRHGARHGARHGRLHVARAGARRGGRPPLRHLLLRRRLRPDSNTQLSQVRSRAGIVIVTATVREASGATETGTRFAAANLLSRKLGSAEGAEANFLLTSRRVSDSCDMENAGLIRSPEASLRRNRRWSRLDARVQLKRYDGINVCVLEVRFGGHSSHQPAPRVSSQPPKIPCAWLRTRTGEYGLSPLKYRPFSMIRHALESFAAGSSISILQCARHLVARGHP